MSFLSFLPNLGKPLSCTRTTTATALQGVLPYSAGSRVQSSICEESCAKARAEAAQEAAARGQDPEPEKEEAASSPRKSSYNRFQSWQAPFESLSAKKQKPYLEQQQRDQQHFEAPSRLRIITGFCMPVAFRIGGCTERAPGGRKGSETEAGRGAALHLRPQAVPDLSPEKSMHPGDPVEAARCCASR